MSETVNARGALRHITALVAAICTLLIVTVVTVTTASAQGNASKVITSFESETIYAVTVDGGVAKENLGLPTTLRAVVGISNSVDTANFTQATPSDAGTYGYTLSHTVSSSSLSIYKTSDEEYRVYGSVTGIEGEQWFACDRDGTITGVVLNLDVTWSGNYDSSLAGAYKLTAEFDGYTYSGTAPSAVVTVKALSSEEVKGTLSYGDAYISSLSVANVLDGTESFDDDDEAGNDSSASNGIVRSFDTITYDLEYQVEVYTSGMHYEIYTVYFEFILPMSETEAEWDTDSMTWMDEGSWSVETKTVTYDFDGDDTIDDDEKNVECQVLRGSRTVKTSSGSSNAVPGNGSLQAVVQVLASKNETTVTPVFTAWLDYNRAGNTELAELDLVTGQTTECSSSGHGVEQVTVAANQDYETVKDAANQNYAVTVSATLKLNVQIKAVNSDACTATNTTYDLSEGNGFALDKDAGTVTGAVTAYGITLQLYNDAGKGFKGLEYPEGPITFEVTLSTRFVTIEKELSETDQQDIAANYSPLVLSWGPNEFGDIYDGRTLTGITRTVASGAAPINSGMTSVTSDNYACYNGGTWTAVKNGNTITFTVTDYEFSYPLFPNADTYGGSSSPYYSIDTGLENIGCFSAAKLFVLTPYYNSDTNEYILDEYDVTTGNFETTVKDVSLTATSVSDQTLNTASDNSNQMVQTDDSVTSSVALYAEVTGGCTWQVQWTQLDSVSTMGTRTYFYDVLNRGAVSGSWYNNGQNVLVLGSDVAIGVGINHTEGTRYERIYAADVLCKFDGSAVTLTGETAVSDAVTDNGWVATFLYATKKDGNNWESDDEMEAAEIEDLVYYSSLDEVPTDHIVVAYLVEYRPKDGNAANITQSTPLFAAAGATVNSDSALVGNVAQCVMSAKYWEETAYDNAGGNIPSLAGHNVDGNTVALPTATIDYYRTYVKAYYDESGYAGGHVGTGDSLLIIETAASITQSIAQTGSSGTTKSVYSMDNGESYVDYVLEAGFTDIPDGVTTYTNLTISVTLGEGLSYVDGSAYLGGSYTQSEGYTLPGTVTGATQLDPDVTDNGDGTYTLTWTRTNVLASLNEKFVIYYSAVISNSVSNNETLTSTATVQSTGDTRGFNTSSGTLASTSIRVSKLFTTSLYKAVEGSSWHDRGEDITFNLSLSSEKEITDAVVMDTLPYNRDSNGSSFSGDLKVTEVKLASGDSTFTNWQEWEVYYTTSDAARDTTAKDYTYSDITTGGTSIVSGGTVTWRKATVASDGTVTDIPSDGSVTAIVFVGTLKSDEIFSASVTMRVTDADAGDVLINSLTQGSLSTVGRAYITNRVISGLAWLDANEDGQRDAGGDELEETMTGIKVALLKLNDTSKEYEAVIDTEGNEVYVITATGDTDETTTYTIASTNSGGNATTVNIFAIAKADGSYEFNGLPAGTYAVRFTSSDSVDLGEYVASPTNEGSDYTDSDGVPYYNSLGQLAYTQIEDIYLPSNDELATAYYYSRYNDSGFYYGDFPTITEDDPSITETDPSVATSTTDDSSTDDADTTTDGSLPTTGDTTNPRLAVYAAITSALAVSAIASGFILRRRNRYQGAHFRRI